MNIYNKTMFIIDLFFPKFCLNCYLPGAYICPRCQKDLKEPKFTSCFFCQKRSLYGLTHQNCLKKLHINGVSFLFYYNNLLKKIIKNTKYRLATEVLRELTRIIKPETFNHLEFYKKLSEKTYLQPIPLSPKKFRERGFNQAFLITKFFQKYLNFPITDFLVRIKETKSQAELKTKKERYNNLKGAFKINPNCQQDLILKSRIILIDDVITTGSTVKEAAKTLKKAGADKVYVLGLAKG